MVSHGRGFRWAKRVPATVSLEMAGTLSSSEKGQSSLDSHQMPVQGSRCTNQTITLKVETSVGIAASTANRSLSLPRRLGQLLRIAAGGSHILVVGSPEVAGRRPLAPK